MTENDTETVEAAPTCYRHPDRETYVRCTRCDRPICPDCMAEAAVGFQCPECVREGNKAIRQARTVFGGRVGADGTVTKVLIALCVLAYVGQLANARISGDYGLNPRDVAYGEWWRLITSAFLHVREMPLHIAFNMYVLFAYGTQVERLLGRSRFLVLYLVAALGGSVATYWLGTFDQYSIGASGAVFGLFGAYFVLARKLRADTSQILLLIGVNLAITFGFSRYIAIWAHVGGLATGALVAWIYAQAPRGPRQALLQYGGAALATLVLVVGVVVRTPAVRDECPEELPSPAVMATLHIADRCDDILDDLPETITRYKQ